MEYKYSPKHVLLWIIKANQKLSIKKKKVVLQVSAEKLFENTLSVVRKCNVPFETFETEICVLLIVVTSNSLHCLVWFAIDSAVSTSVSQLLTCDLMTCVLNCYRRILNV